MKIKNSFLIILLAILVISCDKKRVFDEYKSVGNSWHKDSIVAFDLPQLDKAKKYNLFLNIRDNNDYPFNNLFLIVSMEMPNKKVQVDTLEYQMSEADGSLLGDGFTDVKESKLFYKEDVNFNLKGKYKVKIQQANRQTGKVTGVKKLAGITEVGFRIESKE
jgi:gliding motility-associated lipoprotein GldH